MKREHPSYERPTIQEVICEIRFRLTDGTAWNDQWFSDFTNAISKEFPRFEPFSLSGSTANTTNKEHHQAAAFQILRYHHAQRQLLIQLSGDRIVINALPEYLGWAQMIKDMCFVWGNVATIIDPSVVSRVALRYVNRFERSVQHEHLAHWIKPNNYISQTVLDSLPDFTAVMSSRINENTRLNVGVTDQVYSDSAHGAFILDIDFMRDTFMPPDVDNVAQEFSALHESVWEVFDSVTNGNLEKLLRGQIS